ncbi:MAG: aminopeptidase N C-terminal domain-containing protein, partial [Proteobacteria bacterium]|nr:aminopeptidase N C-terminal domain-containing protein [Pseudomonadota bacterium]
SSSEKRREILAGVYADWHTHLSGYANYLRVVSSGTCDDVFDMIAEEKARDSFDINQPTWNRALFMAMAMNNRMVWTERGIEWVADTVIMLAPINSSTAGRLLSTFQHVKSLKPALGKSVAAALKRVVSEVSVEASASINGQAKAYLG